MMTEILGLCVFLIFGWIARGFYEDRKLQKFLHEVQEQNKLNLLSTIKVYLDVQESGSFFVYEGGTDRFLFNAKDKDEVITMLKKSYPEQTVLMSREDATKLGL